MKKENIKLLEILMDEGHTDPNEIMKLGLSDVVAMGKLTYPQIVLLDQLQKALKANMLLPWLAGKWPEKKHET